MYGVNLINDSVFRIKEAGGDISNINVNARYLYFYSEDELHVYDVNNNLNKVSFDVTDYPYQSTVLSNDTWFGEFEWQLCLYDRDLQIALDCFPDNPRGFRLSQYGYFTDKNYYSLYEDSIVCFGIDKKKIVREAGINIIQESSWYEDEHKIPVGMVDSKILILDSKDFDSINYIDAVSGILGSYSIVNKDVSDILKNEFKVIEGENNFIIAGNDKKQGVLWTDNVIYVILFN